MKTKSTYTKTEPTGRCQLNEKFAYSSGTFTLEPLNATTYNINDDTREKVV